MQIVDPFAEKVGDTYGKENAENESALNLSFGSSSSAATHTEETTESTGDTPIATEEHTAESIKNMTVRQLKKALKSRGLSDVGLKADCRERFLEHIEGETAKLKEAEAHKQKKKSPAKTLVIESAKYGSDASSATFQFDVRMFVFFMLVV